MSYEIYDEPKKKWPTILFIVLALGIGLFILLYDPHKKTENSENDTELKGTCYHYQQLDDNEKKIYETLYTGCLNFKPEIAIPPAKLETCERVLCALRRDHPEFFWIINTATTTSFISGPVTKIAFTIPENVETKYSAMEQAADEIVKNAPKKEYDIVKYFYEYIINNTEYNLNAKDNQTAYSVIINKSSVCGGYSAAFLYLCDKAGIYSGCVTGEIEGSENHAWNFVQINGKYYWVDATWGEPNYKYTDAGPEDIFYDYLCVPDSDIFPGRILSNNPTYSEYKSYLAFTYPTCTDSSLNYYANNGIYIDTYNRPVFYNIAMTQSSFMKNDYLLIKFSSTDELYKAVDDLFTTDSYWLEVSNDIKKYFGKSFQDKILVNETMNHLIIS